MNMQDKIKTLTAIIERQGLLMARMAAHSLDCPQRISEEILKEISDCAKECRAMLEATK